jgi:pyruvate/2-oxoglutarate dehydrogenase complex dihydrolipoamide acyltransferase (E2) component
MEYEAIDEGTLARIVIPAGTADVPVNQLIAVLAGEGEDVKAAASGAGKTSAPSKASGAAAPSFETRPAGAPQLDFAHFSALRRYQLPTQKMGSWAMMCSASSSGTIVEPNGPTAAQRSLHNDQ